VQDKERKAIASNSNVQEFRPLHPKVAMRSSRGRNVAKVNALNSSRFLLVSGTPLGEPAAWEGNCQEHRGRIRGGFQRIGVRNFHQAKKGFGPKKGQLEFAFFLEQQITLR
jgi:hypothetical protein